MKTTIETRWSENLAFTSIIDGHQLVTDAPSDFGGNDAGPSPKKLMMASLAGCTGIDVVSTLKKMRVAVEAFSMEVQAALTEDSPSLYSAMHVIYRFKGKGLDEKKLRRAVELSQDKYCGVSEMYRRIMEITWEIRVEE